MKIKAFLVVNDRGGLRVVKTFPHLDFDEVAVQLNLELPDELFRKPTMVADLVIPKDAVQRPNINVEVTESIAEAIRSATGVEVRISVPDPEDHE